MEIGKIGLSSQREVRIEPGHALGDAGDAASHMGNEHTGLQKNSGAFESSFKFLGG